MRARLADVQECQESGTKDHPAALNGFILGVLGPLHINASDAPDAPLIAPKLRSLLALLLINSGHVVPVSALMRELWEDHPPASALRTVQTYILNARKLLARLSGLSAAEIVRSVLATRPGGYVFHCFGGELDWLRFRGLTDSAVVCLARGDRDAAIRRFDEALGLWRGDAFADVPGGPVIESKRREYEESRLGALEARAETKINTGQHREVIADLAALTAMYPLHEGVHAQYMRALSLSGRRAQALDVYLTLHTRLVTEVGIEPGRPIRQIQSAILSSGLEPDRYELLHG